MIIWRAPKISIDARVFPDLDTLQLQCVAYYTTISNKS